LKADFDHRLSIFIDNFKMITEHNNLEDAPFKMAMNKFGDLTEEELIKNYGGMKIP